MAPSALRTRYHAERGLARPFVERSSLLGNDSPDPSQSPTADSASPSPSQTGPAGVTLPPHGVVALIGIIVVLSIFILGFGAWRTKVWHRKRRAAGIAVPEKYSKHVGLFDGVHEDYKLKHTLSGSSSNTVAVSLAGPKAAMTRQRTAADFRVNLAYQPKVVYIAPQEKTTQDLDAPPLRTTFSPPHPDLQITPPPAYAKLTVPALSPRTAASKPTRVSIVPAKASRLPRIVVVETTFTPTFHDELEIREGEILRLLEEYEDEWCFVERVGPKDAEKGVIPRFCVIEKPEVVPSKNSKHDPRLTPDL